MLMIRTIGSSRFQTAISIALIGMSLFASNLARAQSEILTPAEQNMVEWIDLNRDQLLSDLKRHVEINTGTANIDGLNQYRELLDAELKSLGFDTQTHRSEPIEVLDCKASRIQIADHLVAKRVGRASNRVLINGHMDTVFSLDDEFQHLIIEDNGVLKGPGVVDMKGGVVVMINALRAIHREGLLDEANLTVLFNSDEEIGSLGSRQLIEDLAKQHDIGLVFEGSFNNLATRARKGLGQARLRVVGRESHAGGAHQDGVSASLEIAHKVIEIEKLTDYKSKVTVNTGVLRGGEKRNTIPGCAEAYIDMRFPSLKAGRELEQNIIEIASSATTGNEKYPELPVIDVWTTLHRPVKDEHPVVDALIEQAMNLSQQLGEPITGTRYSGGGTDGSIAQSVGLPTMDSLGMNGKGAHSSREESSIASLVARTKLAAVLLSRQLHK